MSSQDGRRLVNLNHLSSFSSAEQPSEQFMHQLLDQVQSMFIATLTALLHLD
jgi:hypothetical protein